MKTITLNLYEFNELSDKAKEKAREWYRRATECDNYFSEHVIDEAVQQGELLGFEFKTHDVKLHGGGTRQEPCIWWSGFSSQGDGACFEGTWRACGVKADKVAEGWGDDPATTEIKRIAAAFAKEAALFPHATFKISHVGRYSHKYSVDYDFTLIPEDSEEEWGDNHKQSVEQLKELSRDFMRWIYRQLEKEYEYQNSDECVDENIRCNEYTFTKDGNRFG
jgi:hypothetical protein